MNRSWNSSGDINVNVFDPKDLDGKVLRMVVATSEDISILYGVDDAANQVYVLNIDRRVTDVTLSGVLGDNKTVSMPQERCGNCRFYEVEHSYSYTSPNGQRINAPCHLDKQFMAEDEPRCIKYKGFPVLGGQVETEE